MRHVLPWISAVAVLLFSAAFDSVLAAGSAQVAFSPESVDVNTGDTGGIDVTVANVDPDPGLGSYDLTLAFDPAVVRLDSFSDSGFITSGQNVVICVTGQIDNTGGSVNATCTAIPLFGAPGVSTTGPVALLHASFTALASGTSPLTISGSLSGPSGTAIAASFGSGSIIVAGSEAASLPTAAPLASVIPASAVATNPPARATLTSRASATPSAGTAARPTTTPITPKVPATGGDGGHGIFTPILVALLAGGAVAIAATGSAFVWRRRHGKRPT